MPEVPEPVSGLVKSLSLGIKNLFILDERFKGVCDNVLALEKQNDKTRDEFKRLSSVVDQLVGRFQEIDKRLADF